MTSVQEWTDGSPQKVESVDPRSPAPERLWSTSENQETLTRSNQKFEKPHARESRPDSGEVQGPTTNRAWPAKLAHREAHMEREGAVDYENSFTRQELLKMQTRETMSYLKDQFREALELFNEARQTAAQNIHLYKVLRSEDDFMLFRNSYKLMISGARSGRILFAFNQYLGTAFGAGQQPSIELVAVWGPLDQLYWTYKGQRIELKDVVRYFFSEFVQQSYR